MTSALTYDEQDDASGEDKADDGDETDNGASGAAGVLPGHHRFSTRHIGAGRVNRLQPRDAASSRHQSAWG